MNLILSAEHRPALAPFLRSNTLMAFDYDGTLALIANDPKKAEMRADTKRLLRGVVQKFPTVVITGRARSDVRHFLQGVPLLEIVGNHGGEIAGAESINFDCVAPRLRLVPPKRGKRLDCLRESAHSIA